MGEPLHRPEGQGLHEAAALEEVRADEHVHAAVTDDTELSDLEVPLLVDVEHHLVERGDRIEDVKLLEHLRLVPVGNDLFLDVSADRLDPSGREKRRKAARRAFVSDPWATAGP